MTMFYTEEEMRALAQRNIDSANAERARKWRTAAIVLLVVGSISWLLQFVK